MVLGLHRGRALLNQRFPVDVSDSRALFYVCVQRAVDLGMPSVAREPFVPVLGLQYAEVAARRGPEWN